jgi:hypothetical protein
MNVDDTFNPLTSIGSVVTPHLSFFNIYFILKLKLNLAFLLVNYVILVII